MTLTKLKEAVDKAVAASNNPETIPVQVRVTSDPASFTRPVQSALINYTGTTTFVVGS